MRALRGSIGGSNHRSLASYWTSRWSISPPDPEQNSWMANFPNFHREVLRSITPWSRRQLGCSPFHCGQKLVHFRDPRDCFAGVTVNIPEQWAASSACGLRPIPEGLRKLPLDVCPGWSTTTVKGSGQSRETKTGK